MEERLLDQNPHFTDDERAEDTFEKFRSFANEEGFLALITELAATPEQAQVWASTLWSAFQAGADTAED